MSASLTPEERFGIAVAWVQMTGELPYWLKDDREVKELAAAAVQSFADMWQPFIEQIDAALAAIAPPLMRAHRVMKAHGIVEHQHARYKHRRRS